jgi:hypothetical protein
MVGVSRSYFDHPLATPSILGGRDGNDINVDLVTAYVASFLKAIKSVAMNSSSYTTNPLDIDHYGVNVEFAGVTQEEMDAETYVKSSLFGLVAK